MAVPLAAAQPHRVVVVDDEVQFHGFVETDPSVHAVLADAADPEAAAHTILRIGAQATLVAGNDLQTQVIERRFEDMARTFDALLGAAVSRFDQVSHDLVDPETGALPLLLNETRTSLRAMLDATFDADSKSSAIAKIDAVFEGADRRVRALLDPDADASPLGKSKREILETVKELWRDLGAQIRELAVAVAAGNARAQESERTAAKGFAFEDIVHRGVARIAAVYGDSAEQVGRISGLSGTKSGDELVKINPEETAGEEVGFVLENKDRRLSMTKTRGELGKAMHNHGARAAIAVFSRPEYAPTPLPFSWSGNQAVLVYDKEAPDDLALQLAYAWGRWTCLRGRTLDGGAIDHVRIEALFTRGAQALATAQSARACFTQAKNQIIEGEGHMAEMVGEVRAVFAELREELSKGRPPTDA